MAARSAPRIAALLLLLVGGLAGFAPRATADTGCLGQIPLYAVDSQSGHLLEVDYCHIQGRFLPAEVEVAAGDWRQYRDVFAVSQGAATVIYATTYDGELWWRRQDAAGAQLGVPVRIGAAIDWSQYRSLVAPQPGYIHGMQPDPAAGRSVVRTFRHPDWASGGVTVSEDQPPLMLFGGPWITSVRWGSFAETNSATYHLRIWRQDPAHLDAVAWRSGYLPPGVTGVVGAEPALYGLNGGGHVVRLEQTIKGYLCDRVQDVAWHVIAESGGSYTRVIVPVRLPFGGTTPSVAVDPGDDLPDCPRDDTPWEWQ